ncbi:MAG TPA: Tic22 family protein [Candidatus Obscuribacterales bacterium]
MSMSLAGMALAGSVLFAPTAAFALPEEQILEKLTRIPVFMIVNEGGQSLTASVDVEGDDDLQVPIVFIDSDEAEAFIEDAESENAALSDDAQIVILPLSDVYAEAVSQLNDADSLVYVPSAASVSQASQILEREIQGVPLYAAVDLERDQYLLTGDDTLPMFFSLADLQTQVATLIESNPDIQDAIGVEITTFETVLDNMEANDPEIDPFLERVQFIPDSATLEYLQSLSEQERAE